MAGKEKQLKRLSNEIETMRTKLNGMFNVKQCLSDPEVYELSRKLDYAIIKYQECTKR